MKKFFFSLTNGDSTIRDKTGIDLYGPTEARSLALNGGLRIIANLDPKVLVTSAAGQLLYATKFSVASRDAEARSNPERLELLEKTELLGALGGWKFDVDKLSLQLSKGACKLLGSSENEAVRKYTDVLGNFERSSRSALKRALLSSGENGGRFEVDASAIRRNGNAIPVRVRGVGIEVVASNRCIYGTVGLIQPSRANHDRVWEMANHDPLTGLANRAVFSRHLDQAIQQAELMRNKIALVLLDLDHLKETNDTLGHAIGDAVLQSVANRLRSSIRPGDLAARVGGDEFALVLSGISNTSEGTDLVDAIQTRLRQVTATEAGDISCGASAGIGIFPDDGLTADVLFKNADIALQNAKLVGRGSLVVYSPDMRRRMERRVSSVSKARSAQEKGELVPFYQPQICLRTNSVVGFEALLRWKHPTEGVLPPTGIADAFEDRELSAAIGHHLVRCILKDVTGWMRQTIDFGKIAFNASRMELIRPRYADELLHQIAMAAVDPKLLEVEIHENALAERGSDRVVSVIHQLKKAGISLALDDFGTGYGSLVHLRDHPIDVLKIDQTFIRAMDTDPSAKAIVTALIKMGESMGLTVVAEGVEKPEQAQNLRDDGCSVGQGYYFGHAIAPDGVPTFLKRWATMKQPMATS